jgi:hypothetical protein
MIYVDLQSQARVTPVALKVGDWDQCGSDVKLRQGFGGDKM